VKIKDKAAELKENLGKEVKMEKINEALGQLKITLTSKEADFLQSHYLK